MTRPQSGLTATEVAVVNEAAMRGRVLDELTLFTEIDQARDHLQTLFNEAQQEDGTFDYSSITTVTGSDEEKGYAVVKAHSVLTGLNQARREQQVLNDIGRRVLSGEDDDDLEPFDSLDNDLFEPREQSIYDGVIQSCGSIAKFIQNAGNDRGMVTLSTRNGRRHTPIYNALFQTSVSNPTTIREPGYVPTVRRQTRAFDRIRVVGTSQDTVEYLRGIKISSAAPAGEGAAAAEGTGGLTPASQKTQDIAVHLPVTLRSMEDDERAEMYLNEELPADVREALESQCYVGNGTSPNLQGISGETGVSNVALTAGDDDNLNNPWKQMANGLDTVRVTGFREPTDVIIAPQFWTLLMTRENTALGFLLGSPSFAYQPQVWGVPATTSTVFGVGNNAITAVMGDFSRCYFAMRHDIRVTSGYINDDLIKRQITLLAYIRGAMIVETPQAFARVTLPATGLGE